MKACIHMNMSNLYIAYEAYHLSFLTLQSTKKIVLKVIVMCHRQM